MKMNHLSGNLSFLIRIHYWIFTTRFRMNWSLINPRWLHFLWLPTIGRRKKNSLFSTWVQVLLRWKSLFWKILFSERIRNYFMYSIFLMKGLSLLSIQGRRKRSMGGNIHPVQILKGYLQNRLFSVELQENLSLIHISEPTRPY